MMVIAKQHVRPLTIGVCLQVAAILVASIIMDGGFCARIVILSIAAYWVGAILVLLRRNGNPTRGDLLFEAWGFLLILAVILPSAMFVTRWLGVP